MPDKIITLDNLACFKGEIEKEIDASRIISTTYSEFVDAITNSTLIPGMHYRITDFVTKINGVYDLSILGSEYQGMHLPYATSAEHPFDLIVLATGANAYNENVKTIQHEGDTYFENSDLAQWEVKWTHKNDRSQYSFADDVNGKGVITYLKDEFDNSAFFDFKNVMNLQFALERVDTMTTRGQDFEYNDSLGSDDYQPNRYGTLLDVFNVLQNENIGNNLEFACPSLSGTSAIKLLVAISDISQTTLDSTMNWTYMLVVLSQMMGTTVTLAMLAQLLGTTEQVLQTMTERQVIKLFFNGDFYYTFDVREVDAGEAGFHGELTSLYGDGAYGGSVCYSNHFEKSSDALTSIVSEIATIPNGLPCVTFENFMGSFGTVGNWCNHIGSFACLNVFGHGCDNNSLGTSSYGNRFGNVCTSNILGKYCHGNSFENDCGLNYLESGCNAISFERSCIDNHFSNRCVNVSLKSCDNNTFGGYFDDNSLYGCKNGSFGSHCNGNEILVTNYDTIFENGVNYIRLTSSGANINDVKICQGVRGNDISQKLVITVPSGATAPIEYKAQGSTEIILGGNN